MIAPPNRARLSSFASLLAASAVVWSGPARAADDDAASPVGPGPHPTLVWFLTQLLPSPEVAEGEGAARFGLRWQVTPILYSFGVNRRLSPWRSLVVEPIVRQSGSVELYISPELFSGSLFDAPLVRVGVRSYFPLIAKGEELSVSLGTSYTYEDGVNGAGYELGVYTLYGTVGLQVTYAPEPLAPVRWITTLQVRYF